MKKLEVKIDVYNVLLMIRMEITGTIAVLMESVISGILMEVKTTTYGKMEKEQKIMQGMTSMI